MKQAVLSHWDMPWLPILALILFVVCFGMYTFWTYKKSNKKFYDQASLIPLEEPASAGSPSKGKGL
jgi:cbb3-type cytochrome oxidase subunit 3